MPKPSIAIFVFYKDQTITANVAIEKNYIFIDDALFEGAICKDCSLKLYKSIYVYNSI